MDNIKSHLWRGDITGVARENGFSLSSTQDVAKGRYFTPKIVNALFEKALQRKEENSIDVQEMINQLTLF